MKAKKLGRGDFYRVCQELQKIAPELAAAKATDLEAAERLSKATGLAVSHKVVAEAREAAGVSWPRNRPEPPTKKMYERIGQLEQDVLALAAQVTVIAQRLANSHSVKTSEAVLDIATRSRPAAG